MQTFLRSKVRTIFTLTLITFSLAVTSCGGGDGHNPSIPGVEGPVLTMQDEGLLVAMVFENLELDGGIRYPVPEWDNSYVELAPDLQSGGTLLSFYVAYADVFDRDDYLKSLPPHSLPGGRPIPGLATGKLPAVAFSIPQLNDTAFYLGDRLYGVFVPLDFGVDQAIATFRFYADGKRAGNISLVGNDENGENGGLFIALDLGSKSAKYIKKRWKRTKSRLH